ncbi:MAG TPA: Ig-like domain-containing protein [Vicinamibacteria bacterium]|nr:Ig-like domain-containing protein [Vicinamibacteria bacterium]
MISVLIIEPAGFPVPDGTVAQFFTTLGHIDSQGKTKDGVVRVNFVSDSRSGTASISVLSGGPAVAPSASPSPGGGGAGSGTGSCSTTVTIGSARPALVKVVPNPPRLANNRCTTITATVFDANGNFVSNVPIIFSVSSPNAEFFQSGGIPIFSDTNGQSSDQMCTRRLRDDPQATVTVTATPPVGTPGTTTVTIN